MLLGIALGLLAACHGPFLSPSESPSAQTPAITATRSVSHALGKTQVPSQPERVVTFDSASLEASLAAGVTPVGTINTEWTHLQPYLMAVESIGTAGEPNLEKTLALRPDLILGTTYQQGIYRQASQIAPTVLAPFDSSADWQAVFALVSEALGRGDAYDQVMQTYRDRLADLRARLGDLITDLEISVVTVPADGTITVYLEQTFAGTILRDAGLQRPLSQRQSGFSQQLSRERLADIDADVIFLWNAALPGEDSQPIQAAVAELKQDPLWQTLSAVQHDRVYEVPYHWIGPGPIAANLVVDDLFQYLVETPEAR